MRRTDLEANRGRTDLWLARLADGSVQRLTTHEAQPHDGIHGHETVLDWLERRTR